MTIKPGDRYTLDSYRVIWTCERTYTALAGTLTVVVGVNTTSDGRMFRTSSRQVSCRKIAN